MASIGGDRGQQVPLCASEPGRSELEQDINWLILWALSQKETIQHFLFKRYRVYHVWNDWKTSALNSNV